MKLVTYRIMVSVDVTMQEGAYIEPAISAYTVLGTKPHEPEMQDLIEAVTKRAEKAVRRAVESKPETVSSVHYTAAEPPIIVGKATALYEPILLVTTP